MGFGSGNLDLDWISWGYNSGYSESRPGKLTQKTIEHGQVEIVDLSIKNGDLTPKYPKNGPFIVDIPIKNGGSFHSFLLVITRPGNQFDVIFGVG